MHRRPISLLLVATIGLLAIVGLLTTVASGDPSSITPPIAASRTATVGAARVPTRSQASAFARAVNLSAADLPGFKVSHESQHPSAAEKQAEAKLMTCLGKSGKHKGLLELGSKSFEEETSSFDLSVSSEVTVLRTPVEAARGLALVKRAHTRACVSQFFNLLIGGLKTPGATIGKVTLTTGTPPAPGTLGSFGWRLSATITVQQTGARASFYVDILGFVYGRAEVTLLTLGVPHPFPASGELKLFSLLVARAKTHGI